CLPFTLFMTSPSLQNSQHGLQLFPHLVHHLRLECPPRGGLELARPAVLIDALTSAFDGVLLGIEKMFDEHDELDLPGFVHPVARAVLCRVEKSELTLPVPQHVRLEVGQCADFSDRVKLLYRSRRRHRHCSGLSSRPISSATLSRADLPRNSTSPTWAVIGSSPPARTPSAAPARDALAP